MQNISILCTDPTHPVNACLEAWVEEHRSEFNAQIFRDFRDLEGGDILFLISCHQMIRKEVRSRFGHTLVIHASALPQGRGMSPHVWQILEGANQITVTLLNAEDAVDSGDIWHQVQLQLDGSELYNEIHAKLFQAEIDLMNWAVQNLKNAQPRVQSGVASYYPRRTPEDSRIDPEKPLSTSFDLLRIADPDRYPAFFDYRNHRYTIQIRKVSKHV